MPDPVLSRSDLNRALLGRQMLLERSSLGLTEVMERMGGLQTQSAQSGYIGLWSRMRDFDRSILTRALEGRRAIQGTMMRATIHTVSAADYWPIMAGVRRANREWFARAQAAAIGDTDMRAVAAAVREELAGGPLRMRVLSERLVSRGFPPRAVAWAGMWVDMVRVPPSGTWERRRADLYGLADAWLTPLDVSEDDGIEHLIRRHLGAFGPAPLKDIAGWMGLNVGWVRPVAERMELRSFQDEDGRPLVDLPDAPHPDPDTPAPVRFLAVWDAILLVHARRTGVLPEEHRGQIFSVKNPQSVNTYLVDGQVAGTWRFDSGEIRISALRALRPRQRRELDEEAHHLATFHAG